ncbi:MAG: LCP family protein [Propionibacteriaceae bacterium]|nr:LCP family protein [Propionibacteriaceae bacterium]
MTQEKHGTDFDWLYGDKRSSATPTSQKSNGDFDWLYDDPSDRNSPTPPPRKPAGRIAAGPAPRIPQSSTPPPAATTPPPAPPKSKPPSRPKVKRVLLIVLLVLALWLAFLIYAPIHAWNKVGTVNDSPAGTRPPNQPGTAILLVGSDSRAGLTPEEQAQWTTGDIAGSRTDVMMIYYIPPTGDPAIISLPRDSYLPIPGHKSNKLNAAYAFGGAPLLIQTVEDATGLRIDGYLEIGFAGFVSLVDLVGGVQVCLDKPMVDTDSGTNLPAGCQTLDGTKALGYVRQRHQDPLGDLGRVQRQREIMTKVIQKLAKPSTVINPVRYWKTCQTLPLMITRGQSTGLSTMAKIALSGLHVAKGNAISLTVPISNPNATTSAGSSVLWDDAKAKAMFGMIAKGDTSQLSQFK